MTVNKQAVGATESAKILVVVVGGPSVEGPTDAVAVKGNIHTQSE